MQVLKVKQGGITLLELLLVITIGMSIFYLALRQYTVLKVDANASQVRANVDSIMQAMAKYYRQNCYGTTNPITNTVTPGTLNPHYEPAPTSNVPIDLTAALNANHLLANALPFNSLIQQTAGDPLSGYIAQFNLYPPHERRICTEGRDASSAGDANCTASVNTGTVVNYTIQVAVRLNNTANAHTFLRQLQGDCLSTLAGNLVTPCHAANHVEGPYVVWERQPSLMSSRENATYWSMLPNVNQFTQMYTTSNILVLTDGLARAQQAYLCGN